jgi:DUF971 family protein
MIVGVRSIEQLDERTLGIAWSDEKFSKLDVVTLRRLCPCAQCVDEWTKVPKNIKITEDVRPIKIESVGSYALRIRFNDQHDTGIYTYQKLREINCEAFTG